MSGRWNKIATRNPNVPNAQPLGAPWTPKVLTAPVKISTTPSRYPRVALMHPATSS